MERPTIDPSSVSPDAPDFFRVPHITVRPQRGPSLSDAAPKASMDGPGPLSEVDARTWRPQSGAPRQYLAADLTTSMGRNFRCPPAVPLTRSLDAFRRDLHRKRDEGAYGSVYARTLRADERAFFKQLGPGSAYNELAQVVKDLLPSLPAQVRGRRNPPIRIRQHREDYQRGKQQQQQRPATVAEAGRRRGRLAAGVTRAIGAFERRSVLEKSRLFDGCSKEELLQTLREQQPLREQGGGGGGGCGGAGRNFAPDIEFADPETGSPRVRRKGEYRGLLGEFLEGQAPAGLERAAELSTTAGEALPCRLRLEASRASMGGGVRVFVWRGEAGGAPGERAHLLLPTDKLEFHSLPDPPAGEPPSGASDAWQLWLDGLTRRLQVEVDGEGAIALLVCPPLLSPQTGLPEGFRLDEEEQAGGGAASGLVPPQGGAGASARPTTADMAKTLRSRRRASVVSSAAQMGGRAITPSRKQITAFFQL